jgi:hypothetical protein
MKNINLHIGSLILDGIDIPPHQRPVLQRAVESELARLLSEQGLASGLAGGGAVRELLGGSIQSGEGNGPAAFGQQIARAVYGGLKS